MFDLPKIELPTYEVELPASGEKVRFRPFTVREEKNMLLALEEGTPKRIVDALSQIVNSCTFGKCDLMNMAQVDVEYLFVNIRNKSMGEGLDLLVKCENCNNQINMQANLENLDIVRPEGKVDPMVQMGEGMWFNMKYPSMADTIDSETKNEKDIIEVMAKCIKQVISTEQTYDTSNYDFTKLVDWVYDLPTEYKDNILKFWKTAPKVKYSDSYTCAKCGHQGMFTVESLSDFFV